MEFGRRTARRWPDCHAQPNLPGSACCCVLWAVVGLVVFDCVAVCVLGLVVVCHVGLVLGEVLMIGHVVDFVSVVYDVVVVDHTLVLADDAVDAFVDRIVDPVGYFVAVAV